MTETTYTLGQLKGLAAIVGTVAIGLGGVNVSQWVKGEQAVEEKQVAVVAKQDAIEAKLRAMAAHEEQTDKCDGAMIQMTARLNECHRRRVGVTRLAQCFAAAEDGEEINCVSELEEDAWEDE